MLSEEFGQTELEKSYLCGPLFPVWLIQWKTSLPVQLDLIPERRSGSNLTEECEGAAVSSGQRNVVGVDQVYREAESWLVTVDQYGLDL